MKLYVTRFSPYARLARMVMLAKGLDSRVQVIAAQTRQKDSPYYAIVPSGRVPCLVREDGVLMEDSRLIAQYFDAIGNGPQICHPPSAANWDMGRLDALTMSFVDGIAVWAREFMRPEQYQSPVGFDHEQSRAARLLDVLDREVQTPVMTGDVNLPQLTLASVVDFAKHRVGFDVRGGKPHLSAWIDRMVAHPLMRATDPEHWPPS